MKPEHVEHRINLQLDLSSILSKSIENLETGSINWHRVNTRLQNVKDKWEEFHTSHKAIMLVIPELIDVDQQKVKQHSYFENDIYNATEECYLEIVAKMTALLDKLKNDSIEGEHNMRSSSSIRSKSQPTLHTSSCYRPRLPRIDLPKFNGSLSEWLPFKDLFTSLVISNSDISSVEKLQYLKTSLIGSASHMLKNTALTANNFKKAWDAVKSFYENERQLVNQALRSLFSLKKISKESGKELETLYTSVMEIYRTLETLGCPVHRWDDILIFMIVQRLDPESVKVWESLLGSTKKRAKWNQFTEFLMTRMQSLQAFERSNSTTCISSSTKDFARSHTVNTVPTYQPSETSCLLCQEKHFLGRCPLYLEKSFIQRHDFIRSKGRCYNCLGPHRVSLCRSTKRCFTCGKHHHTTLHRSLASDGKSVTSKDQLSPSASLSTKVDSTTALVHVVNQHNQIFPARVLLDQGSELSLVTEKLIQQLRIPRKFSQIYIFGVGKQFNGKTRGIVSLTIRPHFDSSKEIKINAHVFPKLTTLTSTLSTPISTWDYLQNLTLADPQFGTPGDIDIIIGADIYGQLLLGDIIKGPLHSPIAQHTSLGWIISGPSNMTSDSQNTHIFHCSIHHELNELLERFWHQEEIVTPKNSVLTPLEQQCEDYFVNTHYRDQFGRYVVRLPFKKSVNSLGNSKPAALRMLNHIQQKFQKDPIFFKSYTDFISEYENLQHMVKVTEFHNNSKHSFFLPHHGVIKEVGPDVKLRVVFNGSCSTSNGVPLNEILHTGPKLQLEIFNVLLWFRRFRYVYACDIEKMYRQILIHPDDQTFQRIFWMKNQELIQYQLTTVTYGLACAPFLALRTVNQLVDDEGLKYPLAVKPMTQGRYVDDIYGGADSIEKAQLQAFQVYQLCLAGGFPLKKWLSNHPSLLKVIPENDQDKIKSTILNSTQDSTARALGLSWNTSTDLLWFLNTTNLSSNPITKRRVLSAIARFYDPLGLLSPILIKSKIFMQELWAINLSWDEPLSESQFKVWQQITQDMIGLDLILIPRWLGTNSDSNIEIHGFCDASQLAMACVVYLRISQSSNNKISILCAKTRVAPLKRMTIPRLELSSAVMLAKLVAHVIQVLNLQHSPCHLWTDSSIVYTWLNHHPSRWKDFVHNRVCFIQEALPHAQWWHISGTLNPADCATRGLSASQLHNHDLWWSGPPWLSENPSSWEIHVSPVITSSSQQLEERQSSSVVNLHIQVQTQIWELLNRYSSLLRLLRITAICKRVILRAKRIPNTSLSVSITPEEIMEAKKFWIRVIQYAFFQKEITAIKSNTQLMKSNPLYRLAPFIDDQGLLRVKGRLEHAPLDSMSKHPYILPKYSIFNTLIIRDAHEKTLHGSTQDTLTYIRQTFWIIGGRIPIRSHILKCVTCTRHRRVQAQQLMGNLPPSRVNPSRAFLNIGLDYAGPYTIKTWKGKNARSYKSWIALFVCLSTSAIHLEIVTDYSSYAFIAAYKRFTARRGISASITSDCGTNFKGADEQLKNLFSQSSSELHHIASIIANDGTKWNFHPPGAPHFGGKWEAGIKSMKYHLKRVVGNATLTYEEMSTLLIQVEAILNSRPLCPLTDDPNDLNFLTPGHFIIGQPLTLIPEPNLESINTSRLSRWQQISQMKHSFWSKWSKSYLQRFHAIYKWNQPSSSITVGSLVFLMDERYPPAKWPLGRVIQCHPGTDNLVRVVTVKTATSTLKRPITKLCPLPLDESLENHSSPASTKAGGNV